MTMTTITLEKAPVDIGKVVDTFNAESLKAHLQVRAAAHTRVRPSGHRNTHVGMFIDGQVHDRSLGAADAVTARAAIADMLKAAGRHVDFAY